MPLIQRKLRWHWHVLASLYFLRHLQVLSSKAGLGSLESGYSKVILSDAQRISISFVKPQAKLDPYKVMPHVFLFAKLVQITAITWNWWSWYMQYGGFLTHGTPTSSILYFRIFPYKSFSYWGSLIYGNPHIYTRLCPPPSYKLVYKP